LRTEPLLPDESLPAKSRAADAKAGGPLFSRRGLVGGVVGAACMLAIGPAARLTLGPEVLVRPPGGQDEARFIGACIRCDRCRSACPKDAIGVANVGDGFLNARTPKMDYHKGFCDFCMDAGNPNGAAGRVDKTTGEVTPGDPAGDSHLLCISNCPTGALLAFDHNVNWVGVATIFPDECIAYRVYGGCRVCVDKCPFGAVTLDGDSRPVVDPTMCSGCGSCEYFCPSHTYRAFTGTSRRGINIEFDGETRPEGSGGARGSYFYNVPAGEGPAYLEDTDAQSRGFRTHDGYVANPLDSSGGGSSDGGSSGSSANRGNQ
jgi:ferredoxin-type protein NapG